MIFQKVYRDQESWSCVVKLIPVVDHFLFNLFSWNPRRIQLIHVWRRRGYISICILSRLLVNHACSKRIYHSTALCILLWLACRTGAILGRFQASRNEREAKRKNNACSAGYFWSVKIPWHSCHIPVSRSEGLGQRAMLHLYFLLFLVPFHVVSGQ